MASLFDGEEELRAVLEREPQEVARLYRLRRAPRLPAEPFEVTRPFRRVDVQRREHLEGRGRQRRRAEARAEPQVFRPAPLGRGPGGRGPGAFARADRQRAAEGDEARQAEERAPCAPARDAHDVAAPPAVGEEGGDRRGRVGVDVRAAVLARNRQVSAEDGAVRVEVGDGDGPV
jgi:hypothetical protein